MLSTLRGAQIRESAFYVRPRRVLRQIGTDDDFERRLAPATSAAPPTPEKERGSSARSSVFVYVYRRQDDNFLVVECSRSLAQN